MLELKDVQHSMTSQEKWAYYTNSEVFALASLKSLFPHIRHCIWPLRICLHF